MNCYKLKERKLTITSDARGPGPVYSALLTRCIVRLGRDKEERKEEEEEEEG